MFLLGVASQDQLGAGASEPLDLVEFERLLAKNEVESVHFVGLDATIKLLPCRTAVVDGELHGTLVDLEGGARPASVYDVYGALQGDRMLRLKYAAFDLLYLDGEDLTRLPLHERRRREYA